MTRQPNLLRKAVSGLRRGLHLYIRRRAFKRFMSESVNRYRKTTEEIERALVEYANVYCSLGRADTEVADAAAKEFRRLAAELASQIDALRYSGVADAPSARRLRLASVQLMNLSNQLHRSSNVQDNFEAQERIIKALDISSNFAHRRATWRNRLSAMLLHITGASFGSKRVRQK